MMFLLNFTTILCNFESLRTFFTEVLVFENIVCGQLSYSNLIKVNPNKDIKQSSVFYGEDLRRGILIHQIDKNFLERRIICIDKKNLSKSVIHAFSPETRTKINDKNVSVYFPPIISIQNEDEKVSAVRSDFHEKELPQLIYSTKLFERVFINKEKTKRLISKIVCDIKEKTGIYNQLKSGDYILLYFNGDFTLMEEFFNFFEQRLKANNLNNVFIDLFKNYEEIYFNNRASGNYKDDEESYPMACMFIDVSNILCLAENEDYIFEILNTDHKNSNLTGKVCLLVESRNLYNLNPENIHIFDDNNKVITCNDIFTDEKFIKILLDLSKCFNSKTFSIRIEFKNELSVLNVLNVDLKPFLKSFKNK